MPTLDWNSGAIRWIRTAKRCNHSRAPHGHLTFDTRGEQSCVIVVEQWPRRSADGAQDTNAPPSCRRGRGPAERAAVERPVKQPQVICAVVVGQEHVPYMCIAVHDAEVLAGWPAAPKRGKCEGAARKRSCRSSVDRPTVDRLGDPSGCPRNPRSAGRCHAPSPGRGATTDTLRLSWRPTTQHGSAPACQRLHSALRLQ